MSTNTAPGTSAGSWRADQPGPPDTAAPAWWVGAALDGPHRSRVLAAQLCAEARHAIATATEVVHAAEQTRARARARRHERR